MFKTKTAITVIILGLLATFALLVVFKTDSMPQPVQVNYYGLLYKLSYASKDSKFMIKAHEATKTKRSQYRNPYSFYYTYKDKKVIKKDSVKCMACHGSMKQKVNGKPKYRIHNKMLNVKLVDFGCTNCHKKVDLGKRRRSRGTIKVDRRLCTKCHEANKFLSEQELKSLSLKLKKKDPNLYIIIRHGRDKRHAKDWVRKNHFRIAKIVGVNKCRRCHKKGSELYFCGHCHSKEP